MFDIIHPGRLFPHVMPRFHVSSADPRELLNSCSLSQAVVTCGVVLQYGVLAEALEPPGDQDILEVCRGGVVTAEGDGGKQGCAALQLGNIHLNTHKH